MKIDFYTTWSCRPLKTIKRQTLETKKKTDWELNIIKIYGIISWYFKKSKQSGFFNHMKQTIYDWSVSDCIIIQTGWK